jgi:hypothetical protein
MHSIFKYTTRNRRGGIDGLNLFFGALLGANLGTTEYWPRHDPDVLGDQEGAQA